jgi:hypothetical protein
MARAVAGWSPVIMMGWMPACWAAVTAWAASGRGGSAMATSPYSTSSRSVSSIRAGRTGSSRPATASTRYPWVA